MLFYEKTNDIYLTMGYDGTTDPRVDFDHSSTFITWENGCSSPDKNPFKTWNDMLEHFDVENSGNMTTDLANLQENALQKGYVLMPVWKYEHGDVNYKAADAYPFLTDGYKSSTPGFQGGFDGGLCGVIYEEIGKETNDIDEIKRHFDGELIDYTNWANGNVYDLAAYDKNGEYLESVGGIYPDENSTIESLAIDYANDYFNINSIPSDAKLEEVHYEYDYMPVDIDPDLVDDEFEFEDMEYRSLTIEERIAAHQEYLQEYANEENNRDEEER